MYHGCAYTSRNNNWFKTFKQHNKRNTALWIFKYIFIMCFFLKNYDILAIHNSTYNIRLKNDIVLFFISLDCLNDNLDMAYNNDTIKILIQIWIKKVNKQKKCTIQLGYFILILKHLHFFFLCHLAATGFKVASGKIKKTP